MPAAEEMTLLSKIIKSHRTASKREGSKVIQLKPLPSQVSPAEQEADLYAAYFEDEKAKMLEEIEVSARLMEEQAKQALRQAEEEIQQQKQAWEEEKQLLSRQAYDEGFLAGQEQGRREGYKEYEGLITVAKETVDSSKQEYERNVQKAEKTILAIAIKSAEKIIGQQLSDDKSAFLSMIQQALKEMPDQQEIQIHVHPSRYPFVLDQKEELEAMFPLEILCYIYPNEKLSENGCFIETSHGRIDISLDSQLEELRKQLFALFEGDVH